LALSLAAGIFFAWRNARKNALPIWDNTALRLLINLGIPLAVGGIFCLILFYHGYTGLAAPATLIFYGLALINASKYSINEIRSLGLLQVVAGLLAAFFIDYGLLFWAFGFGLLHVVYGILIYVKYEK
jgi:VIT1/CCC1 family predicted Fe2+/Mn2+ transporter